MRLKRKTLVILLAVLSLAWCGVRWGNARTVPNDIRRSSAYGLSDCPASPNCVSTSSSRPEGKIAPIALREAMSDAMSKLDDIIRKMPGSRVVVSRDEYLHAEFRSRVFGFVDDLEILIDKEQQIILIRSASRVGYSDLDVNRKRVEEIRRLYSTR